jgi:hypothetical protein
MPAHIARASGVFLFLLVQIFSAAAQGADVEPDDLNKVVRAYHSGLAAERAEQTVHALSRELFMWNGGSSDDPVMWQPHLYLADEAIDQWVTEMVEFAGPHENVVAFLNTDIRGDSGIVVTSETGNNKFRSWTNESVVYLLGRTGGDWKIVGLFVRDVSNPQ